MHDAIRRFRYVAAIALATGIAFGVDPPDLRINVTSGLIETVDATWSGNNFNVRFTETTGSGQLLNSAILTSNTANDVDPRVAVAPGGDILVVWWRDLAKDAVQYRKRSAATGAWGVEKAAGAATEANSHPRIVYDAGKAWVAYQIQNSKSKSIGAQIIDDDPEPFRTIVATTNRINDLDIQITSESSHLWLSWIDNGLRMGYVEYDHQTQLWSLPLYEPYFEDSVAAARARIRQSVLGL